MKLKKKIKKLAVYSSALMILTEPIKVSAYKEHAQEVHELSATAMNPDSYIYLSLEDAKKACFIKDAPTKEQLLNAVYDNDNIKENYKKYFIDYIKAYCKKYKDIDKSLLYYNIKNLKEVNIKDISENNQAGTFNSYKKEITLDDDLKSDKDILSVLSHEIGHGNQTAFLDDAGIYISFRKNEFGRSFLEELNTYCTDLIGFDNRNAYPENIPILKDALGLTNKEIIELYAEGHINDITEKLTELNPDIDAEEFVTLNDEQLEYLHNYEENATTVDKLERKVYKTYIDYFFSRQKKNNYANYETELPKFAHHLSQTLENDNGKNDKNDSKIYHYLNKTRIKTEKVLKKSR